MTGKRDFMGNELPPIHNATEIAALKAENGRLETSLYEARGTLAHIADLLRANLVGHREYCMEIARDKMNQLIREANDRTPTSDDPPKPSEEELYDEPLCPWCGNVFSQHGQSGHCPPKSSEKGG